MIHLIMVGGAGKRLWPLSSDKISKSFIKFFDGKSLLQIKYNQLRNLGHHCVIITNPESKKSLYDNLPNIRDSEIFYCESSVEVGGALLEYFNSVGFSNLLSDLKYKYDHVCIHYPDAIFENMDQLDKSLLEITNKLHTISGTIILGNKNIGSNHTQTFIEINDSDYDNFYKINRFIGKFDYEPNKDFLSRINFGVDDGILFINFREFILQTEHYIPGEKYLLEDIFFSNNNHLFFYNINNKVIDVGSLMFLFGFENISSEFKYNIKEYENQNTVVINDNKNLKIAVAGITDSLIISIDNQLLIIHKSMLKNYKNTLKQLNIKFRF